MTQYGLNDEFVRVIGRYLLRVYTLFIRVKRMNPFYVDSEFFPKTKFCKCCLKLFL